MPWHSSPGRRPRPCLGHRILETVEAPSRSRFVDMAPPDAPAGAEFAGFCSSSHFKVATLQGGNMEKIPVSMGYRRELTWRFRLGCLLLVALLVIREYFSRHLHLEFSKMPLEAIWNPPPRNQPQDKVALVELLNYSYLLLFVLWIRIGVVLSLDFIALQVRNGFRRLHPHRQIS
jgi:hypothetical protein